MHRSIRRLLAASILGIHNRKARRRRVAAGRGKAMIEPLEPRMFLSTTLVEGLGDGHFLGDGHDHGEGCSCSACCGTHGLPIETAEIIQLGEEMEAALEESGADSLVPLNDTFLLHSNPGVNHTIYLDFDGTGFSNWSASPPTGYDNYVSLGQFRVTGTIVGDDSINNQPTATADSGTAEEDGSVNIDVLANDSDPDSDLLTVASVTQGASGTVVIEADDTVTYTPAPDFNGSDSFTYTISDGRGGSDTATVDVTVHSVADISISATNADRQEGNGGTTAFAFTIALDAPVASEVGVDWAVAGSGSHPADAADFGGHFHLAV